MLFYNKELIKNPEIIEKAITRANYCKNVKVVVRCTAFNQEKYIEETLKGFIIQKTDFKFVVIVHDDHSSDRTKTIIAEYAERYPNIIHAIIDEINRYSENTLHYVMDIITDAYHADYIAICEGDDVWTDSLKLQKQVDYMELHPECVMCHGDYTIINGQKRKTPVHYDDEQYFGPNHIHNYTIGTLTTLFRCETYNKIPKYYRKHNWIIGDKPLWIELSQEGKFHYMNDIFGAYRILPNSASHSTNGEIIKRFWKCENEIAKFYNELYGYDYVERNPKYLYEEIQKQCYKNKDKNQAKKYWKESINRGANSYKAFLYYFCNIWNLRWMIDILFRIIK